MLRIEAVVHAVRGVGNRADSAVAAKSASAAVARAAIAQPSIRKQEITPLQAAKHRGCLFQVGTDMLYEMIPAYLEFFGHGTATPDELRAVSRVSY